ncbi:MAG TPA: Ig-like domain repeat protein, partial [Flavisolibacter sp.]|nr:Ig-like domain repeat protein [Flavisolibacter sp.]
MQHGQETILELTKHYRRGGGSSIPKRLIYFLFAFLIFSFTRANAQLTLTQSKATSCFNTNVVFTATITPDPIVGSVDLYDGAVLIGSVSLSNGTAVFNINNLTSGTHTLKATYLVASLNTLTESNTVTHVVNPSINPGTIDLTGGAYCSSGTPGTINSTLAASGGNGTLTYAWQSSSDCNTWSGFISGATAANYTPGSITQTTCYRRSVTDECGNIAYTAPVQFTVYPQPQAQTIVGNLASGAVCAGTDLSATFSGGSAGIPGRTDFTDIYQYSTDGGTTWMNYTPGSPIATGGLSGSNVVKIRTRREPAYTSLGCAASAWNELGWSVNPMPGLTSSLANARTNSSSFTYVPSSDVSGTQFSWSRDVVAGISNPAATGTGSINETLVNTTRTAIDVTYEYTLTANGCTNTESIVMSINGMLAIAYNVTGGGSYCQGGSGVPVGLSNSETGVTYQLIRDGVDVSGVTVAGTGSAISFPNQTVAGTYTVRATDANGSIMMTGSVDVTINTAPSITTQPQSVTNGIGCGASFTVAATGTPPLSYQWRKNGTNINGATTDTYSIGSIVSGDGGNYDVVITNACGSVTSSAAVLTVYPSLTAGSHNTTSVDACMGYSAPSLDVTGTTGGKAPYSYQWKLNGTDIGGANTSSYTPVLSSAGTYIYNVEITDGCNQVVSTATKTITIVADPVVTASGGGAVCQNSGPTLTGNITGGTGTLNYQWQSGTSSTGPWTNISGATSQTYAPSTATTGTSFYRVTLSPNTASCDNSSTTIALTVNALPTATITGATAVCQNTTQPNVTFTGANGTAPYTFTYTINGGSSQTVTTTSGNSVTVPVSTTAAGTFTYALVSVSDAN